MTPWLMLILTLLGINLVRLTRSSAVMAAGLIAVPAGGGRRGGSSSSPPASASEAYGRGEAIGVLERWLALVMIVRGDYSALAFIIAAKALARHRR